MEAITVCGPSNTRSWWISSETMRMSRSRQNSAIAVSSDLVQTRPQGLWGEQRMSIRVLASTCLASASRSIW